VSVLIPSNVVGADTPVPDSMYAKVLAPIPIEPRTVHELTPCLWWQYFSLGMVTVAVLDYFLTLDDEVCDLRVSALSEANLLVTDQPYMEQTEVMDVLRILPGQNSPLMISPR
jgi:hypothetical protein